MATSAGAICKLHEALGGQERPFDTGSSIGNNLGRLSLFRART
ncbi:Uncharacterised protein [Burkholderia pseudomallei]|nr:Uncharacterised protein [Burkholderia pseudomallei]VCN38278.1 Uncharacterised protein [Burkholderia pseudomallei]VCN49621.1 Uncharacterised protein [Burkholderia pseudomallei]VCN64704.1 Uncharacterised protein [Burkholderia pseudomallei]VCN69647.1 Uncharacterised protein [Burkholderia pseudomallei]